MIIAITILSLSFAAMVFVVWNKRSEMSTGKTLVTISNPERDTRLLNWYDQMMYQVTHVSYRSLKNLLHSLLEVVENFFLRIFMRLGKRFHTIGDIVRGKNIPKNRGSVSFFLKNIEQN